MKGEDILQQAMQVITRDQKNKRGLPEEVFTRVAEMWSAYVGYRFTAQDVCVMMVLNEVARIKEEKISADNFVGIAGYAALAAEVTGVVKTDTSRYSCKKPMEKPKDGSGCYVDENGFTCFGFYPRWEKEEKPQGGKVNDRNPPIDREDE